MMDCRNCLNVFERIGAAFNSPIETPELLALISRTIVERFQLAGSIIRLLSRDRRTLDEVASFGLSQRFLQKGPVNAERSVAEALEDTIVMIPDCRSDPRVQYPAAHSEEGIVSMLTVPLSTRGQVIGVLRLYSRERREFEERELEVLKVVASFCAAVVVHSMFHRIIENVARAVRSSLDLDAVLHSVVRVISEDLRAKGCFIQLLDPQGQRLGPPTSFGLSDLFLRRATAEPWEGPTESLQGACFLLLDARDASTGPFAAEASAEGVGSMLYVPVTILSKPIGLLCVCTHHAYEFSEDELFLMKNISDQCALAIHNAQAYGDVKRGYQDLADDFQRWFEQTHVYPGV